MLEEIHRTGGDADKYLAKAKDKKWSIPFDGIRSQSLQNFDPRAKISKKNCWSVLSTLGVDDPILAIKKIRRICTCWWVFCFKKIISNVDFYSGIIYRALGFLLICLQLCLLLGTRLDCTMERNERKQRTNRKTKTDLYWPPEGF
jgi:citrate synthase